MIVTKTNNFLLVFLLKTNSYFIFTFPVSLLYYEIYGSMDWRTDGRTLWVAYMDNIWCYHGEWCFSTAIKVQLKKTAPLANLLRHWSIFLYPLTVWRSNKQNAPSEGGRLKLRKFGFHFGLHAADLPSSFIDTTRGLMFSYVMTLMQMLKWAKLVGPGTRKEKYLQIM